SAPQTMEFVATSGCFRIATTTIRSILLSNFARHASCSELHEILFVHISNNANEIKRLPIFMFFATDCKSIIISKANGKP
ncbi:MAG TPA: hypothetical protein VFN95_18140, partial [Flavitalea sp.]|nr:hypothetical protein [Flavitalea sp.]